MKNTAIPESLIERLAARNAQFATQFARAIARKHLEHVFEKLGVENRGAASLRVLEVLGR